MEMETLKSIDPAIWITAVAILAVCAFVVLNKAIVKLMKIGIIVVAIIAGIYYLIHSGIIELPR